MAINLKHTDNTVLKPVLKTTVMQKDDNNKKKKKRNEGEAPISFLPTCKIN